MSKKPLGVSAVYVILGLLFIALIGIRTISTPEIWSHLAQGRTNAPLSFLEGDSVVNTTHLYDKVAFGAWNAGGAPLLILLHAALVVAAFGLMIPVSKKWGGPLSQSFALLIAGSLLLRGYDVGPQAFMMLFIAAFVFVLSTQKNKAVLFGVLVPLQILWTNIHGSFLFGPLIAALAAIEVGQAMKGGRRKKVELTPQLMGILAVVLLVVTFANPYAAKLHSQVVANIKAPYPSYWASLLKEYFQVHAHGPLIFFTFILGAGGLITLKKKLPVMLTTLAIVGAFLVMRTPSMSLLYAILAFPFMVLSLTAVGDYLSDSFRTVLGKREKIVAPFTQAVFVILLLVSLVPLVTNSAYTRMGSTSVFGLGVEEELYPSGAAAAVINHPAFPEKVLNLEADGGYLAWAHPGRKIYMDFRAGRYSIETIEQLHNMMLGDVEAYDAIYDAHRPEGIIINTLSPVAAQGLVTLLERSTWRLAYFDGTTAILLQNKEKFSSIFNDKTLQANGLAQLEAARAAYAEKLAQGGHVGNPGELIGSAKIFLAFNRPKEAKALFALLLQSNRHVAGAWIGLGNSQMLLQEFDDAVATLKRATDLAPSNLFGWVSYAKACKYAGNTDEMMRAAARVESLAADAAQEKVEEQPEPEFDLPDEPLVPTSILDIPLPE